MQIRDIAQRIAAVVNLALHAKALGHVGDLNQRRDAPGDHDIAAQHIGGALGYPWRHAVESARDVLQRQ